MNKVKRQVNRLHLDTEASESSKDQSKALSPNSWKNKAATETGKAVGQWCRSTAAQRHTCEFGVPTRHRTGLNSVPQNP